MIMPSPARGHIDLERDAAAQTLAGRDSDRLCSFRHLRIPVDEQSSFLLIPPPLVAASGATLSCLIASQRVARMRADCVKQCLACTATAFSPRPACGERLSEARSFLSLPL